MVCSKDKKYPILVAMAKKNRNAAIKTVMNLKRSNAIDSCFYALSQECGYMDYLYHRCTVLTFVDKLIAHNSFLEDQDFDLLLKKIFMTKHSFERHKIKALVLFKQYEQGI